MQIIAFGRMGGCFTNAPQGFPPGVVVIKGALNIADTIQLMIILTQ
jgi:hypothetical protein